VLMPRYFGAATLVALVVFVLTRVWMLRRRDIQAVEFGKLDRTDFLIPPFALVYFYVVFATAFGWPTVGAQTFLEPGALAWVGVVFCFGGLALMLWSLASFGTSFRVGIDVEHPDRLVTTGAFAHSRNPIYVAFALVLLGEFLIFLNWVLLAYLIAGFWLFNRQVMREESYLATHYGQEFSDYRDRVRRYL